MPCAETAWLSQSHGACSRMLTYHCESVHQAYHGLSRMQELQDASLKLLSQAEDADMSQTIIDCSTQQAVYQAALKSGANLIQPSLMDFLTA